MFDTEVPSGPDALDLSAELPEPLSGSLWQIDLDRSAERIRHEVKSELIGLVHPGLESGTSCDRSPEESPTLELGEQGEGRSTSGFRHAIDPVGRGGDHPSPGSCMRTGDRSVVNSPLVVEGGKCLEHRGRSLDDASGYGIS
ncbi:hypothetical protein [Curtobacterium sp. HSID17257]|uniref:hypothetical protein n=1 Tax=Curtobacterium sp. HSID17257 TaxID=2419510 RepID=UPI000F87D653|nr:hypothetical protein [Curtobacterium sp. HSID17257]